MTRLQVRQDFRDKGQEEISQVIEEEAIRRSPEAGRAKLVTDVVDRLPLAHRIWFALAVVALAAFGLWLGYGR